MSNKPKYAIELLREAHKRDHPNCNYGNEPHFVPPSFGQIGFYMCDPPEDITNHTRCRPPYDHEHADHLANTQYNPPAYRTADPIPTSAYEAKLRYNAARQALLAAADDAKIDSYLISQDCEMHVYDFLRNRADSL